MGAQGVHTPLEIHKWLKVSLEILVRSILKKQLDPSREVCTAICEIIDDLKNKLSGPPVREFAGSGHV